MEQTIVELPLLPVPVFSGMPAVDYLPRRQIQEDYEPEQAVADGELSKVQRECLEELAVFHHATADILLRRLNLSPNSLRYLQKHLDALCPKDEKKRFVEKLIPPKQKESRFGSAPYVYRLGRKGFSYLRQEGFPVGRYRKKEDGLQKPIPLRHRLAVNECLLKAMLLERDYQGVQLLDYRHEEYWNAKPLQLRIPTDTGEKKRLNLSPDLLLHFLIDRPKAQYRFLPEINLSRVWEKDWRERVRAYLFCMDAYEERFKTELLTAVPVIIASPTSFPRRVSEPRTEDEKQALAQERTLAARQRKARLNTLLQWTEAELTKLGMQQEADLFCFTDPPLDEISPFALFFSPIWYQPFAGPPQPLMRYERGDGVL